MGKEKMRGDIKMRYEEKVIEIDKLYLDKRNYRIDFDRYNTEEKAVERLYLDEDIIGMIKGIVNHPGLYPHDKMIALPKGNDRYTVLEGNRRLLAAKSLLGIIKPPAKYAKEVDTQFSKLDDETKESLRHIGVVIYDPGDKGYLKILADKHSSFSYRRWDQISQWHFFKDLYDLNKKDLDLTAKDLGKSKVEVSSYIRYYNLFSYIRSLTYWDEKDIRELIESNTLKATKFTRSLGFTDVKRALSLDFDNTFEIKIPAKEVDLFNEVLCKYAEASLILDDSEDDFIYTRSSSNEVVELINSWKREFVEVHTSEREGVRVENVGRTEPINKERAIPSSPIILEIKEDKNHKKPSIYFEDLKCTVEQQRLKRLTTELKELSQRQRTEKFAASATMLTRGLLESCLHYQVKKKGKLGDYMKSLEYKESDGKVHHHAEGLKNLITFVIDNIEELFQKTNLSKALSALNAIQREHLEYLNSIVHDSWRDPTAEKIHNVAGDIRELLKEILNDTA